MVSKKYLLYTSVVLATATGASFVTITAFADTATPVTVQTTASTASTSNTATSELAASSVASSLSNVADLVSASTVAASSAASTTALATTIASSNSSVSASAAVIDSSALVTTIASDLGSTAIIINTTATNGNLASQADGQDPQITSLAATGSVYNDLTGPATLDDLNVVIKADNLNPSNFLTPDGLHWSDSTQVIPIIGSATGAYFDTTNFGLNGPTVGAPVYTMNVGDSGRITNVGTTLNGLDLDLIYTITATDQANFALGQGDNGIPVGIAFLGEQAIAGSEGNSIAVLYNGANNVDINYQIVDHNTNIEMPVLMSMITTDIDDGQGVGTNFANLLTVIPNTTNLTTDTTNNSIYDSSANEDELNGEASLPYGGYLGVGFASNFYYDFYSPAPERNGFYSHGVRYDLFGSALQAHLNTQVRDTVYVNYYNADMNNQLISGQHQFIWFPGIPWNVPASAFHHYAWGWENQWQDGDTIHVGDYYHIQSTVTFNYYGSDGTFLGSQQVTGLYRNGYLVDFPTNIGHYDLEGNSVYYGTYETEDQTINVYYRYVPPVVYYSTYDPYATTYYSGGTEYIPNYSNGYYYSAGAFFSVRGEYLGTSSYQAKIKVKKVTIGYSGRGTLSNQSSSLADYYTDSFKDTIAGMVVSPIDEVWPASTVFGMGLDFYNVMHKGGTWEEATIKSVLHASINTDTISIGGGLGFLAGGPIGGGYWPYYRNRN